MKKEIEPIKFLLARFFEGQTSDEEEQELYRFFGRDDIPEELMRYAPVIRYFENGFADEMGVSLPAAQTGSLKRKNWIWYSVAASFLLMLCSSIYYFTAKAPLDPYAGSYIIRNGVRITDLELIRPELEATIQKSLLLEQEAERLIERLTAIDDSQEMRIMQQIQEHNQRILDHIQDENIRLDVEDFLYPNL